MGGEGRNLCLVIGEGFFFRNISSIGDVPQKLAE